MAAASLFVKHRPAGEVHAVEVTDKHLDAIAEQVGGQVFTAPERLGGQRYIVFPTADGASQRVDLGGYVVQHGTGKGATFEAMDAGTFTATYVR